jgi:hypothetical protein
VTAEQPANKSEHEPVWQVQTKDPNLRALVVAFESLPITSRLHYVSNLLLDRMERDEPMDPHLVAAYDILESVRVNLDRIPDFDQMMRFQPL